MLNLAIAVQIGVYPSRHDGHNSTGSFWCVLRVRAFIARLVHLKKEVETSTDKGLKRTISGDAEAHLFAAELGAADVGIIFSPVRLFPSKWHQRGMSSTHGTKRRFSEAWESLNARFDATWVALEAGLSEPHVLSLVRSNLERLLGAQMSSEEADPVAYYGTSILNHLNGNKRDIIQ
ncbi:hypothetical protein BU17DRAFT_71068 [Hysterangium stoloniferum]|nr:hypothetical protein BU17DRAFT_71068 [Hysterangium stoloniferum]